MTLPYEEGDWFAVPLRDYGYGVGIAARVDGKGGVLGYFFGPRRTELPALSELTALSAGDSVLVQQFGDLSLIKREWPVIGHLPEWDREHWPMPAFGRHEELSGRALKVEYSSGDLNSPIRETSISPAECDLLPKDGILSSGAVEIVLTHTLVGAVNNHGT
jgi:hypothetical protein